VRDLVDQEGYPAATIEAIAARSGVAKTTIYRWWPHRPALAVEVLAEMASAVAPAPEEGDPVQALRTELRRVAEAIDGLPGRLLLSLLGEAQQDPETHDALLRGIFEPRRRATARVIRRGQVSGALRRDVPPLVAVDMLYGPLFYRGFILHEAVSGGFVRQVLQHVLDGLLTHPASRR
jgi:AcrR family transcriptional regulator